MKKGDMAEMLNMQVAARELGISKNSLRKIVLKGELHPIMIGCQARFPRWTLIQWQAKATGLASPLLSLVQGREGEEQ